MKFYDREKEKKVLTIDKLATTADGTKELPRMGVRTPTTSWTYQGVGSREYQLEETAWRRCRSYHAKTDGNAKSIASRESGLVPNSVQGRDDVFARRWYSKASGKGAISLYARTNGTTNSVISESSSVPNAQIASSRHSQTMMSSLTSHTKIRKNTHICNFIMLTNVLIVNMLVKLCNKHLSPKLTQNQSYLG